MVSATVVAWTPWDGARTDPTRTTDLSHDGSVQVGAPQLPMTDPYVNGRLMLTKLGYIDGKWQTIYTIHTDPMGYVNVGDHNPHEYYIHITPINPNVIGLINQLR